MIKHYMGMFCCIFLTNILQNRRKRISGDRLESPIETHSMFVVFFLLHVLLLFFTVWVGVNC